MPNQHSTSFTFYNAYCFDLSPTYDVWAKLTVADIHALKERDGFQGIFLAERMESCKPDVKMQGKVQASISTSTIQSDMSALLELSSPLMCSSTVILWSWMIAVVKTSR